MWRCNTYDASPTYTMIFHIILFMVGILTAIYVLGGVLGHLLGPASKRIEKAKEFKVKVKELKKSLIKTLQHKLFPRMILFTTACTADDGLRMIWKVYRYDMDAIMCLVIPKDHDMMHKLETSVSLNGEVVQDSVVQYNDEKEALEAFDMFCKSKFDLYQYVFNREPS
jgi:hypothetical protein